MHRFRFLVAILLVLFILSSCSRELEYGFVVINDTDYRLDQIDFDWCQSDFAISLAPNQTSAPFYLTYKTSAMNAFGHGALCLGVRIYSDVDSVYQNPCGWSRDRDYFSNLAINHIRIVVDDTPSCEEDRFEFLYEPG